MSASNDLLELVAPPESFQKTELLGAGSYGRVYRCTTDKDEVMAVKITVVSDDRGVDNLSEIDILSRLRHPHVLDSQGIKTILEDVGEGFVLSIAIFMEMASCDLINYIVNRTPPISIRNKILYDIAMGLAFIHANNYLHVDLKSSNVLIFPGQIPDEKVVQAKICDFGSSLHVDSTGSYTCNKSLSTIFFRAPELFLNPLVYTRSTDIWAYGMIGCFVITGRQILFSDTKSVREKIYDAFSPTGRPFIEDVLSGYSFDEDIRVQYTDFLSDILVVDAANRATLEKILKCSLFKNLNSKPGSKNNIQLTGYIMNPVVNAPTRHDIIQYRGFDFMMRACLKLGCSTETMFLSGDLYQRILHVLDSILPTASANNEDEIEPGRNWSIFSCVALTCLWMACKMLELSVMTTSDIVILGGYLFDEDSVRKMEQNITETFGGILYRQNLYTVSQCQHKLTVSFNSLYNCFVYHKLDLERWNEMKTSQCDDDCTPISQGSFNDFYIHTDYYKKATGLIPLETKDYVECIYNQDLEKDMARSQG